MGEIGSHVLRTGEMKRWLAGRPPNFLHQVDLILAFHRSTYYITLLHEFIPFWLSNLAFMKSVMMTRDEAKTVQQLLKDNDLDAMKTLVPSNISANALLPSIRHWPGYPWTPLLWMAVYYHQCTDEGHAFVQYLIDQGADPDTPMHSNVS